MPQTSLVLLSHGIRAARSIFTAMQKMSSYSSNLGGGSIVRGSLTALRGWYMVSRSECGMRRIAEHFLDETTVTRVLAKGGPVQLGSVGSFDNICRRQHNHLPLSSTAPWILVVYDGIYATFVEIKLNECSKRYPGQGTCDNSEASARDGASTNHDSGAGSSGCCLASAPAPGLANRLFRRIASVSDKTSSRLNRPEALEELSTPASSRMETASPGLPGACLAAWSLPAAVPCGAVQELREPHVDLRRGARFFE